MARTKEEKRIYMNQWRAANAERERKKARKYRTDNRERINTAAREHHAKNKERRNALLRERRKNEPKEKKERRTKRQLEYYNENRDYFVEHHKEYYKNNKDKIQASNKRWKDANSERVRNAAKEYRAKRDRYITALQSSRQSAKRYGYPACSATPEQIAKAFRGCCDICKISEADHKTRLNLDHSHTEETNNFRGWLCIKCNNALGMVNDSTEIVHKMGAYLELHKPQSLDCSDYCI